MINHNVMGIKKKILSPIAGKEWDLVQFSMYVLKWQLKLACGTFHKDVGGGQDCADQGGL